MSVILDIIEKKRHGQCLSEGEIEFVVKNCADESVIETAQLSALLMAICCNGMTDEETVLLTEYMMNSGDTVDLSEFGSTTVDKHSTGGVGDKTTLIVAPVAASLDCRVAKMSGRGLGHSGGTIDKLEAIPGLRTEIPRDRFIAQVRDIGLCVAGQSGSLAPADKRIYSVRNCTATVDSIPLIASSIMSKKLAAGSHSIVLDVKLGSGAFMKTRDDAERLARTMVAMAKALGRNAVALITDMDIPLGAAVGNSLEIAEAVEVLRGGGSDDLREVCIALASNMVALERGVSAAECTEQVMAALADGSALEKLCEMVTAQGGDARCIEDISLFKSARLIREIRAPRSGYITRMDAELIGKSSVALGAGATKLGEKIDHSAGIMLSKKTGEYAEKGEVLARLHTSGEALADEGERLYLSALEFGEERPEKHPLIIGTVS